MTLVLFLCGCGPDLMMFYSRAMYNVQGFVFADESITHDKADALADYIAAENRASV